MLEEKCVETIASAAECRCHCELDRAPERLAPLSRLLKNRLHMRNNDVNNEEEVPYGTTYILT